MTHPVWTTPLKPARRPVESIASVPRSLLSFLACCAMFPLGKSTDWQRVAGQPDVLSQPPTCQPQCVPNSPPWKTNLPMEDQVPVEEQTPMEEHLPLEGQLLLSTNLHGELIQGFPPSTEDPPWRTAPILTPPPPSIPIPPLLDVCSRQRLPSSFDFFLRLRNIAAAVALSTASIVSSCTVEYEWPSSSTRLRIDPGLRNQWLSLWSAPRLFAWSRGDVVCVHMDECRESVRIVHLNKK